MRTYVYDIVYDRDHAGSLCMLLSLIVQRQYGIWYWDL